MIETHSYRCRCGATSPRFSSRKGAREWHTTHVRDACTARREATTTPKLDFDDLERLQDHARKLEPLDPRMNGSEWVVRGEPKRVDLDRWGGNRGGGVRWTGANCLRASIANLLGASDLERVPDPTPLFFSSDDWLSDYSEQLAEQTGYRLEEEPAHVSLHGRNAGRLWIACIAEPGKSANHAVVARGSLVYHDPAQHYGTLPVERVLCGFVLVPKGTPKRDRWGAPIS